jgi:hypothetical protein
MKPNAAILGLFLAACTARSVTPPLSPPVARGQRTFGTVYLSSGVFKRPHQVIGVVQLTQTGYKWLHEIEVIDDANAGSILFKIGEFARQNGADGIQSLELIDMNPQTPGEKKKKQLETAMHVAQQLHKGEAPTAAEEGTETRYEVKGELVVFTD